MQGHVIEYLEDMANRHPRKFYYFLVEQLTMDEFHAVEHCPSTELEGLRQWLDSVVARRSAKAERRLI